MHPEPYRTYNIDRNINYTNICTAVCDFCAFYRPPKHAEGYVLDREELLQKIQETVELGGDQILMQGGLHPQFKLEWYEELLRDIKAAISAGERARLQPAGDSSFHQGCQAAAAHGIGAIESGRIGKFAGRRRRDFGRSGAQSHHSRQSADRRLAECASRVARTGRAQHGHDDVRSRGNFG